MRRGRGDAAARYADCPDSSLDTQVPLYNAAAASALPTDVLVNDLYAAVTDVCGEYYSSCDLQRPADVHYTAQGQEFLGTNVSAAIVATLAART